jgi:hypothetical protein
MKLNFNSWLNNLLWIALFIGVVFHAITFGYTASWILVFILFGLYVFNALTLIFPLFYLEIVKQENIIIDPEHNYNHYVTIKHRLDRHVYLPYLSLTVFFDHPKTKRTSKVFSFYHSRVQMPVSLNTLSRGVFKRPDVRIQASDFFNIFHKAINKRLLSTIYVLPKIEDEATNLLITKHLSFVISSKKLALQKSFEFNKLKEYTQGDNTKLIDWKTTSKTQTLTVKELEYEKKRETYFIFCGNEGKEYEYLLSVFYTLVMNILSTSLFGIIDRTEYNEKVKQVDFALLTPDNRNEQVLLKLHDYVSEDSNKVIFIPSLNESLLLQLQDKDFDDTLLITVNASREFVVYQRFGGVYEKN